VGVLFVLLHVPLYLPGHIYEGLPLWPSPIILLAGAVLLTWIYLRTGSALLAGLMHASLNASVPLTWGLDPAWVWQARAAVLASIAIVLVLVTGRWWLMAGSGTNVRHEDRPGTGATPAVSEPPGPPPPRRRRNAVLTWTRRVVSIVLGLLFVLVSAGAGYESIMYAGDATRYPPAGRQIDVGGHHMHLHCLGAGSPTVIMEGGGGGNVLHWMTVQPDIALSTRVCVYDRAGMGWSEPGPLPRTPERIVAELHGLLVTARVPSPYVLVGHSIGGKYVRLYAARYPLDVAGMVLVDPRHESADAAMSPARRAEDQDGALAQQRRTRVRG
jgi:hypothetical protein